MWFGPRDAIKPLLDNHLHISPYALDGKRFLAKSQLFDRCQLNTDVSEEAILDIPASTDTTWSKLPS